MPIPRSSAYSGVPPGFYRNRKGHLKRVMARTAKGGRNSSISASFNLEHPRGARGRFRSK